METVHFAFDNISILEWYDGLVRAVASQQQQYYLLILAAWDINSARKAYAIIELDPNMAGRLLSASSPISDEDKQKQWDCLTKMFKEYVQGYQGAIYLTLEEPARNQGVIAETSHNFNISSLADYDLEQIVSKSGFPT